MTDSVQLVRQAFAAQAEGDLGPARALIADDAAIHVPGALGFGDLRGADGLATLVLELLSRSEGSFGTTFVDAIGTSDIVTSVNQVSASRGGRMITYDTVWTFRFRDDRVVEAWLHPSRDEDEIAQFYGLNGSS